MPSTRRHSYDLNFKLKIVAEAEAVDNNREIAREYGISESMVRKWRNQQHVLFSGELKMTAKRASMGVFNSGHDSFFECLPHFVGARSDVNHFKHVLLITRSFKSCGINNALDGTEDSMKMIWFGTTTKKKKQKTKKSRLTTSLRQTAQPSFHTNGSFQSHPVLFRTNKSDKVDDQRCLSFVYSFTGIYLHIYFSLALIIREIWKSYISLRENTRL